MYKVAVGEVPKVTAPVVVLVTEKLVAVEVSMVNVPLYPAGDVSPATTTVCPIAKPFAAVYVTLPVLGLLGVTAVIAYCPAV